MFKIIDFFAANGHVYQSIKPIINPIRLLYKGLIPAKYQGSSSNCLGENAVTRSENTAKKKTGKKVILKPGSNSKIPMLSIEIVMINSKDLAIFRALHVSWD